MKAITNQEIAGRIIRKLLIEQTLESNKLFDQISEYGPWNGRSIEEAQAKFDQLLEDLQAGREYKELDKRTSLLIELDNTNAFIERLNATLDAADEGRLLLGDGGDEDRIRELAGEGRLVSPAGFSPDQRVFVEVV